MKKPNSVEECLHVIQKMKESRGCQSYISQLEKIESYIRGEIMSSELLQSSGDEEADNLMKGIVYRTLNKIINYQEKDIYYYVELPKDMFYNTLSSNCILAGKEREIDIAYNRMDAVGPNYEKKSSPTFNDNHYVEITGDFSSIPEGVMLYRSDWYKIIAKYPHIHQRMYSLSKNDYEYRDSMESMTFLDSASKTDEEIQRWTSRNDDENNIIRGGREEQQHLPQEVIDSIEFQIPEIYLPGELVKSGDFGTFKDILDGKYIQRGTTEETIIDVLKNRFRGVSAIQKGEMAFFENQKELMLAKLRDERAKLSGYRNYWEQKNQEKFDARAKEEGFTSFRQKCGLPEIEITQEEQERIDEITRQIEEIERNWEERANG